MSAYNDIYGMDVLKHYCGIFGCISTHENRNEELDIAHIIYLGLVSLQHRGQECAGIAIVDQDRQNIKLLKLQGLISHTCTPEHLLSLQGNVGIGHTRYSTQAGSDMINCQPFLVHTTCGQIAIAHNGELMNAQTLRKKIQSKGVGLSTSSDSELISQILSIPADSEKDSKLSISKPDWKNRILNFMKNSLISYSLLLLHDNEVWAIRDPFGNRPLCIGQIDDCTSESKISNHSDSSSIINGEHPKPLAWIVSSESCAFASIGAKYYREIVPGEIVRITARDGPQTMHIAKPHDLQQINYLNGHHSLTAIKPAFCLFEYIYFARSDSIFEGQQVYTARLRCGRELALEAPVLGGADLISTVPDSATPAALGYSQQSGIPYLEVLTKNPYIGRTFIQPNTRLRKLGVSKKFGVLSDNIKDKRIVLIDDSIVRGTTMLPIIKLLKDNGAKEVHVRVSSPPVKYPCFMGINIPTCNELIANKYASIADMATYLGADSLAYLSLSGLVKAITKPMAKNGITAHEKVGYCSACFTGNYPVPLDW